VVNGRLTARSARRFGMLGRAARAMFADLSWVGAQDDAIAARFIRLGVASERVEVTSSLKWDTAEVADHIKGETALASAMGIDRSRPLWVCGSTGPDEEIILLDAHQRLLRGSETVARGMQGESRRTKSACAPQLAIVPRKPERFGEVARLIERAGFTCVRRSEHPDGGAVATPGARSVLLGDTMGELRKFYSLADVTFVGRSLVPMGGSDPMEVAALARPIVVGPYMDNFRLPIEALAADDAVRVVSDAEALSTVLGGLLRSHEECQALGLRARAVVLRHQGATARTVDGIMRVLHDSPPSPERHVEQETETAAESAR
jgi:3-deoxy-D-manno-octulosonic-acid transferase